MRCCKIPCIPGKQAEAVGCMTRPTHHNSHPGCYFAQSCEATKLSFGLAATGLCYVAGLRRQVEETVNDSESPPLQKPQLRYMEPT